MQTKSKQTLGTAIFLLGLFLGLALACAAIWGDFEAMSYFYSGAGYDAFGGMRCPLWMSRSEVANISATFDNPSDEEILPYYEVEISGTPTSRNLEDQVPVQAHTSRTVQWTVDANDIDLGYFVMVKMDILPVAGYSTREATCGILVFNLSGLTGGLLMGWTLAASLLPMVVGLAMWESREQVIEGTTLNQRNALRAAGVATLLAMLAGFMGSWLIGAICCAIAILLLVILLRFAAA